MAGNRLDTRSEAERSALRRDRFGFVFQSGQLVPELTAEENVALPLLWSGTRRGRPWPRPGRGLAGWAWTGWSAAGPRRRPPAFPGWPGPARPPGRISPRIGRCP